MPLLVTLTGIDDLLARHGGNEATQRFRLLAALRARHPDDPDRETRPFPADDLIALLWDTDSPDEIKAKRKALSSLKSATNKFLRDLATQGENPEGIVIGRDNTFTVSEEHKDDLLKKAGIGPDTTKSMLDMFAAFNKLVMEMVEGKGTDQARALLDQLEKTRHLVQGLAGQGTGIGGLAASTGGDEPVAGSTGGHTNESDPGPGQEPGLTSGAGPGEGSPGMESGFGADDGAGPGPDDEAGAGITDAEEELVEIVDDEPADNEETGPSEALDEIEIVEETETAEAVEPAGEFDTLEEAGPLDEAETIEDFEEIVEVDAADLAPGAGAGQEPGLTSGSGPGAGGPGMEPGFGGDEEAEPWPGGEAGAGPEAETIDAEEELVEIVDEDLADQVETGPAEELEQDEIVEGTWSGAGIEATTEIPEETEILETDDEFEETEEIEQIEEVEEIEDVELPDDAELVEEEVGEPAEDLEVVETEEIEETEELEEAPPSSRPRMFDVLSRYLDPAEALTETHETLAEPREEYLHRILERFTPRFIAIPAGEYLVGSKTPQGQELPLTPVYLERFHIGQYPVTNDLFDLFVRDTGYVTEAEQAGHGHVFEPRCLNRADPRTGRNTFTFGRGASRRQVAGANWRHPAGPASNLANKHNHPVVQVSRSDALAFAAWAGKRLPSEPEWEAAARGQDSRPFPWGNAWRPDLCNLEATGLGDTSDVTRFGRDSASPFAILDLLGNVLEWTSTPYHPGSTPVGNGRELVYILKGGCWTMRGPLTIPARYLEKIGYWSNTIGFRCVA